ncbi:unnamed protein product [Mucor fragilis]
MRDMRYESSGYGAPPPNYQMAPYGGDSYRPERDRDRDIPPSPSSHLPYYERDRLDDRDYYNRGPRISGPSSSIDYDRYRSSGRSRPSWGPSKMDDSRRMMDRDRPERISTNVEVRSGRTSPTSATASTAAAAVAVANPSVTKDRTSDVPKVDDKKKELEPRTSVESNVSPIEKPSATAAVPEETAPKAEISTTSTSAAESIASTKEDVLEKGEVIEDNVKPPPQTHAESMDIEPQEAPATTTKMDEDEDDKPQEEKPSAEPSAPTMAAVEKDVVVKERSKSPEPMEVDSQVPPSTHTEPNADQPDEEKPTEKIEQVSCTASTPPPPTATATAPPPMKIALPPQQLDMEQEQEEKEQGEATAAPSKEEKPNNLTQEQIVERIDDIENQISTYEDMLEAALKREEEQANTARNEEEEDVEMADDEDENEEEEAAQNKEEAKKQALQAMENEPSSSNSTADMMDFSDVSSPIMRKRPQLLINQLRSKNDHLDDELYEKILQDNRAVAQHNSRMVDGIWQGKEETAEDWLDQDTWSKPLYARVEDYPCYKENVANFAKMQISVAHALVSQEKALKDKERRLKAEYRQHYKIWKQKNLYLDHRREDERKRLDRFSGQRANSRHRSKDEPEEYSDNVIFVPGAADALRFKNDGASTPYGNGYFTSDAVRSEAELLEIIQSLESAEMRNPESRAKKTTATIPPMILDSRERMRTYDDRSGLVEDPLTYYHTGPDTGDVWNQQEVTTFMESYMMYPKQFERISIAIGTKTAPQCVLFYYRKKKKIDFKALMKKGRRGKATKHRDRIAAAIRAVTGDSAAPNTRKAKSKGSALMTDIGEAQVSRKAKEKDAERRNRERREVDPSSSAYEGLTERKRTRRPTNNSANASVPPISTPVVQSGAASSASDDTEMASNQQQQQDKRRPNSGSTATAAQRRKGRSSRETTQVATVNDVPIVLPAEPTATKRYVEDLSNAAAADDDDDDDERANLSSGASASGSTKWSEREREMAIEAFKQHGRDFVQVASLIQTKTEEQCRNFYHNFKRRFGANAFNEEQARPVEPIQVPATASPAPMVTSPVQTAVHHQVVALSGRTDLKAEEEDAAAALVGMFQMGANTPREELTSRSRTSSSHEENVTPMNSVPAATTAAAAAATTTAIAPQPAVMTSSSSNPTSSSALAYNTPSQLQQQQQRRRRVRSTSSRSESVPDDASSSEWPDSDFAARAGPSAGPGVVGSAVAHTGSGATAANAPNAAAGRKLGRTTTVADARRPTYSSYWSVSERNEFSRYLTMYGRDWEKVANAMKSKTMIQVRNFYANNEEKLNLREYVNQHQARQQQQSQPPLDVVPPPPSHQRDMAPSFDTSSAAHFQALQSFPFPAPMQDQTPSPRLASPSPQVPSQVQHIKPNSNKGSPYMMNRTGYMSASTPPPPTRIAPSSSSSPSDPVYSNSPRVNYAATSATRPIAQAPPQAPQPLPPHHHLHQPQLPPQQQPSQAAAAEAPSAVTKVADLLNNNDDPAEPSQNSWETWFGS